VLIKCRFVLFSTKDMFTSDRKTLLLYSQCHDCQLVGVRPLVKHVSSCTDPCCKGPPLLEFLHAEMAMDYLLMGQSKHHKGWMDGWVVGGWAWNIFLLGSSSLDI
jgi:hypothetical protein